MADGRMLRKKVSRDGRVAQLSVYSALLYLMAIPHLDREGRMDGNPVAVRGTVVPARVTQHPDEWTDGRVESYILEWAATADETTGLPRPLVLRYCTGGTWVCHFLGFADNQAINRGRERPSSFPPPPPTLLARLNITVEGDAVSPVDADSTTVPDADSGSTPELLRTQAEAEVQVQEPPEQREVSRAHEAAPDPERAALQESPSAGTPDDLARGILDGVQRRQAGLVTHGPLGRLLEVLSDADDQTPAVLHSVFDGLPVAAIEHARREVLDVRPHKPSAYAVGIGKRFAATGPPA